MIPTTDFFFCQINSRGRNHELRIADFRLRPALARWCLQHDVDHFINRIGGNLNSIKKGLGQGMRIVKITAEAQRALRKIQMPKLKK